MCACNKQVYSFMHTEIYIYRKWICVQTYTCMWVGCQGGAPMRQGDEKSALHCPPSQLLVALSSAAVRLVPLSPSLSRITILEKSSAEDLEKDMNRLPKLFRRSPVSDVEIISWKIACRNEPWPHCSKKRTMTSPSKARIVVLALLLTKSSQSVFPDSDPPSQAR